MHAFDCHVNKSILGSCQQPQSISDCLQANSIACRSLFESQLCAYHQVMISQLDSLCSNALEDFLGTLLDAFKMLEADCLEEVSQLRVVMETVVSFLGK